jgi:putative ABC transport system permease protein
VDEARAQLASVGARLARQFPDTNGTVRAQAGPLDRDVTRAVRGSLLLMLGAVVAVLAIACLNVANLLVVRALGRHRELAVSSALGADRRRLATGLLVESLLLATLGGAAGLALARGLLWALKAMAPAGTPRLEAAGLDLRVLGFALAATLATGVLFGLLPAWHASRTRPADLLRAGEGLQASRAVLRWRGALLTAEVALALVLLAGAALVLRSVARLNAVDLGFETRRGGPEALDPIATFVLAAATRLRARGFLDREFAAELGRELSEQVRANPIVRMPSHLVLVGRVLGLLSGVNRTLESRVDLLKTILPYVMGGPKRAAARDA